MMPVSNKLQFSWGRRSVPAVISSVVVDCSRQNWPYSFMPRECIVRASPAKAAHEPGEMAPSVMCCFRMELPPETNRPGSPARPAASWLVDSQPASRSTSCTSQQGYNPVTSLKHNIAVQTTSQ